MRRLIALAFATALIAVPAFAQDTTPRTGSGSTALSFMINGFGNFGVTGSFAGNVKFDFFGIDTIFNIRLLRPMYGLGMKSFVGDKFAIRGALGFNLSSKTTTTVVQIDSNTSTSTDNTETAWALGIAPGFEYHFAQAGPVSAYAGAFVGYSTSVNTTGPDSAQSSDIGSTFSFGPILGVEYFPWSNVSLGAEYQLGLGMSSSSRKVGDKETDGPSYFDAGVGALAVGLNVYFGGDDAP